MLEDDVICLSDDETEQSNKPSSNATKESTSEDGSNVREMVEVVDHKWNLCDLANAALAAEANLNLMAEGQKDDCFSCSTSPKDENDVKGEPVAFSDEHNLSCQQGSISSSVEKRDPDASTPDSFVQNIATTLSVGHSIRVRGEGFVQRSDMRVLEDGRTLPGSPSCSQISVDKNHRQKGPRIAKVVRRINCNVELLEFGMVISGNLWSNSRAIFPKGFKSRVRYINISDPTNMCNYVSEILDGGSRGPLFMVSLEHFPSEVFVQISPTRCWEVIRERVNQEDRKSVV